MWTFHVEKPASCFNKFPCIYRAKLISTGLCSVGINYLPFTYTIPVYLHTYPRYVYLIPFSFTCTFIMYQSIAPCYLSGTSHESEYISFTLHGMIPAIGFARHRYLLWAYEVSVGILPLL